MSKISFHTFLCRTLRTPRESYDLTLAVLGKKVKKQQEVSDLNQDYPTSFGCLHLGQ